MAADVSTSDPRLDAAAKFVEECWGHEGDAARAHAADFLAALDAVPAPVDREKVIAALRGVRVGAPDRWGRMADAAIAAGAGQELAEVKAERDRLRACVNADDISWGVEESDRPACISCGWPADERRTAVFDHGDGPIHIFCDYIRRGAALAAGAGTGLTELEVADEEVDEGYGSGGGNEGD